MRNSLLHGYRRHKKTCENAGDEAEKSYQDYLRKSFMHRKEEQGRDEA